VLRVTVLGCGGSAGVPLIGGADGFGDWGACDPQEPRNRRTRASILVETAGRRLLVDTSPDLRTQLLACGVPRVDAILYTHSHADHITGLDDVRILNRIVGQPLDAFGTAETLAELARRFDYAFRPWQPPNFFRPVLAQRVVAPGDCVPMAAIPVAVFPQDHGFTPTLGVRIGQFAYSTDVVALGAEVLEGLRGVHTWLVDCFQREPHSTHAHLDLVRQWVAQVAPRRTVLTHMGADMDWGWLQANLPAGIEAAYDGQALDVPWP
jgi:phosphoribosyl 1,2-cyclic phosphate phosphodiesterase